MEYFCDACHFEILLNLEELGAAAEGIVGPQRNPFHGATDHDFQERS